MARLFSGKSAVRRDVEEMRRFGSSRFCSGGASWQSPRDMLKRAISAFKACASPFSTTLAVVASLTMAAFCSVT
jgi:hypothetical protein